MATKTKLALPPLDVIEKLLSYPVVIVFPHTRHFGVRDSLAQAGHASVYAVGEYGNGKHHLLGFASMNDQLSEIMVFVDLLAGIQGVKFYFNRLLLNKNGYEVKHVVNCYIQSQKCTDWRAHCHRIIRIESDEPISKKWSGSNTDRFITPCHIAVNYNRTYISAKHPSSLKDQLQAAAVAAGCDWCPNFDAAAFLPLDRIGEADRPYGFQLLKL